MSDSLRGLIGYIVSLRRGGNRAYPKQALIRFPGVDDYKTAHRLLNRVVEWRNDGTKIRGVIKRVHGRTGTVIAYFKKPLPGQAVGSRVVIIR